MAQEEGPAPQEAADEGLQPDPEKWAFNQGDEIVPGIHAMSLLGGGHQYEAYLAWHDKLHALVVVKIVRPHLTEDEGARRSLTREVEALRRLHHPMLVRSFGADLKGKRPHVVLEHLEGPHLARLIRKQGGLPLEQVVPLALQISSVLAYLATEEMVHLDIKPRNIIMGIPPRVIDLSIARPVARARRVRGFVGTDLYMAPEQADRGRWEQIGTPADVWGLGVTLYHAIAGRRAFDRPKDYDESDLEMRFPQLKQRHEPLPYEIDPHLREIIDACLREDPVERPSASEVASDLEPVLASLPRRRILGRPRPRLRRRI